MNILFVCSSNACRSPYCEYVFRRMVEQDPDLNGKIHVDSAGVLNRIKTMDPRTQKALLRDGFRKEDFQGFRPKLYRDDPSAFSNADVIVGMTRWHKYRIPRELRNRFVTLSEAAAGSYTPIRDSWVLINMDQYYAAMDQIRNYLSDYLRKVRADQVQ